MRKGIVIASLMCLLTVNWAVAQDWAQVHREDDSKWSRITRLSPATIHKLWRMASPFADERDDDSRIAQLDASSLAARNHILLVTSSGERNCLSVTVFTRMAKDSYRKLWQEQQTPNGAGFCDTPFGEAEVAVFEGVISVTIPEGKDEQHPAETRMMVYEYGWNNNTYKFIGNRRMNR